MKVVTEIEWFEPHFAPLETDGHFLCAIEHELMGRYVTVGVWMPREGHFAAQSDFSCALDVKRWAYMPGFPHDR